jgi:hypothetical protein
MNELIVEKEPPPELNRRRARVSYCEAEFKMAPMDPFCKKRVKDKQKKKKKGTGLYHLVINKTMP